MDSPTAYETVHRTVSCTSVRTGAGLSNPLAIQIRKPTLQVDFLIWSEYRDSNPRPLGPEIAQERKTNSNASIMCDFVQNYGFSELLCPTRPYGTEALWVTVWVRESYRSAKVGVLETFESDSKLKSVEQV